MLVLSRKPGEKVLIADEITISVLSVQGNRVRLGIEAPANIGCCEPSWPTGVTHRRHALPPRKLSR